jgi:hypothetical protein
MNEGLSFGVCELIYRNMESLHPSEYFFLNIGNFKEEELIGIFNWGDGSSDYSIDLPFYHFKIPSHEVIKFNENGDEVIFPYLLADETLRETLNRPLRRGLFKHRPKTKRRDGYVELTYTP